VRDEGCSEGSRIKGIKGKVELRLSHIVSLCMTFSGEGS
jgi:hypothetical protein